MFIVKLRFLFTGLAEAICVAATNLMQEDAAYAESLRGVVGKLPEGGLQLVPSVFPRSRLTWIGGSVFASLKVP
jgi:hypothetical protein